ncbi:MAG: hypothetical protein JO276_10870 [Sphingomonadaceae bacterium]|nr:hypothetical protein [Sphingomonadaceae bacterium]
MSFLLSRTADVTRSPGDPKVLETGPSSLKPADRFGRALGWFSIGLGLAELLAAPRITRALGAEGREATVRAMGARELLHGILCLSIEDDFGPWTRVGGDVLDLAGLAALYRNDNPKKGNVGLALAAVLGCTIADIAAATSIRSLHRRDGPTRDYADRSGFPNGIEYSRGRASGAVPPDFRATPTAASASPATGDTSPASGDLMLEPTA